MRVVKRFCVWLLHACPLLGVLLLAGCSESASTGPQDDAQSAVALWQPVGTIRAGSTSSQADGSLPKMPALMPTIELSPFWEFPRAADSPALSRLPDVFEPELDDQPLVVLLPPLRIEAPDHGTIGEGNDAAVSLPAVEELADDDAAEDVAENAAQDAVTDHDFLVLLPPVEQFDAHPEDEQPTTAVEPSETEPSKMVVQSPSEELPSDSNVFPENVPPEGVSQEGVSQEGDAKLATGVRTGAKVNDLAREKISRGYTLAERGASYAARQEFIQVLRMISRAKDVKLGAPQHTVALAQGLRALVEAEDFVAHGTQLEADLDVAIIASSHRTPVGQEPMSNNPESQELLPQQLMERYFRYAQIKLAEAVAGEPAGSMALHALGKLNSRQGEFDSENHPLAHRRAFAFQQAALLAHDQNHLAAHELGVLLADSGHYAEAEKLLQQVVQQEPLAVVYRNLARVQKKLGHFSQAAASEQQASRVAQQLGNENKQVQWVTPTQFTQASDAAMQGLPVAPRPKLMPTQPQFRR